MSSGGDSTPSPQRMSTRGVQRINYAELNMSGSGSLGFSGSGAGASGYPNNSESGASASASDDSVFRSPLASTRGKKRRPLEDNLSTLSLSSPKRGRPRGTTGGVFKAPSTRGGGPRRFGGAQGDHQQAEEEKGLFGAVKYGRNIERALDDWIEEYEQNPDSALVRLLQFFINICGCKGVLNIQMISTMEYSDIIRRMTEDFDEDSGDYPLVMMGQQWKKFRINLHATLDKLIHKCKASIIFDQRMMDNVIQLLTGLADSQVRAFRHTATFAAMKISSALVDITLQIASQKEKNSRQIEAEKAKLKNNASSNEMLEVLLAKKNEIEEKTDDVRQMLQYIFKSVFVHRYRDVLPDTRAICITELGNWMNVYPEHFLEDSYLKYIGWTLCDKVPDVRLKCINALLPLYDKVDNLPKLELFTNKFKDRLVSMVLDKDNETAVKTCHLMTSIYRVFPSLLDLQDCIPIYELVFSNHRPLAVAAGEFLNTKVFQHSHRSRAGSVASTSGKQPQQSENIALLKDLVHFYIESECHEHATYLVDALIDTNPMMKDWQSMVNLLLSDEVTDMESQLIEILVCSVHEAATGELPVGRAVAKRGAPSLKESKVLAEDRTKLSEVLIPALPQLLQKFIADREKVSNLITIPLHFQLDMFIAGRLDNYLSDLMRVLEIVVEKHTDESMIGTVADIITYFSTHNAVAQHTETYRLKLIDGLALQLRHTVQRFFNEGPWDEEDEASMLSSFKKINAFVSVIDLKKWDLWDVATNVLANQDTRIPRDIVDKAITFLFLQMNWDLCRLIKDIEPNRNDAIRKLKKRRDQFIHQVETLMTDGASGVETGFLCLCDVLIMFNDRIVEDGAHLEPLVVKLPNSFIGKMKSFVTDNVFSDAGEDDKLDQQMKVELMHKKRNILTQFCKMIIYGIFQLQDASCILTHYCKFYQDYGDILKNLLYKIRELDLVGCAKALTNALVDAFEGIRFVANVEYVDPMSNDFQDLRNLAKRFASALGSDQIKIRDAVASVHRDGIQYALRGYDPNSTPKKGNKPKNITFLEVIMEFSPKLLRQDKIAVMKYLDRHCGPAAAAPPPSNREKEGYIWEPYVLYKGSLSERHDDVSSVRSFSTITAPRGGGRGRGRGGYVRGRLTPTPSDLD